LPAASKWERWIIFPSLSTVCCCARIGASLEKKRLMDRERERTKELERTLKLLKEAQEQLSVLASRDSLTGLGNRRSLEAQLDARLRRNKQFSAIYIGLNGFKKINDAYGHEARRRIAAPGRDEAAGGVSLQ
jgi:PleD family two-component response regulator